MGVAIADFNRDGYPDIAVSNNGSTTVSVLMNNGASSPGTFANQATYSTGVAPWSIAAGDLNGDGYPDIVTGNNNSGPGTVSVLLNNGNGTFASAVSYNVGSLPQGIAISDLVGNGHPDIVTANDGGTTVSVLLNNGNGTFSTAASYTVGAGPQSIAVGDLNGDGKPDIVTANNNTTTISVLLNVPVPLLYAQALTGNIGIGASNPGARLSVAYGGIGVGTAYSGESVANGNVILSGSVGIGTTIPSSTFSLDIAGATRGGELNLTRGVSFAPQVTYSSGAGPFQVAIGDLNGDGYPDIVTANNNAASVSVFLNNGNGTFAAAASYGIGSTPAGVALGDLNGDGKLDIVASNSGSNSVSVLLNNGNGTFATAVNYTVGTGPVGVVVGDLNGDGHADIAVANYNSGTISVLMNNGNGTFAAAVNYTAGTGPQNVTIGYLSGKYSSGSGYADMAVANYGSSNVSVFLNNGNGTFAAAVNYSAGSGTIGVVIGDVSGDGHPDIVTANYSSSNISVLINNGNGTFAAAVNYAAGSNPQNIAIGDLVGNGRLDIVVADNGSYSVSVLLNNGSGVFGSPLTYAAGTFTYAVAVGDLNGDGKADIVASNLNGTISVYLNRSASLLYAQGINGNIGIDTTGPGARLSVAYGGIGVGTAYTQEHVANGNGFEWDPWHRGACCGNPIFFGCCWFSKRRRDKSHQGRRFCRRGERMPLATIPVVSRSAT